jgi:hypothetical protein
MTQMNYIRAIRDLYTQLPQTSKCFSRWDRRLAADLYQRQVPFETVRAALLLTTAHRLHRHGPPLPTIRSLHYFTPAIEETLRQPLPSGYLEYLEHKIVTFK